MDLNDIRIAVTVLSLVLFLTLMAWTWWPTQRGAHAAAAQLPFEGEAAFGDTQQATPAGCRAAAEPACIPPGDGQKYASDEGLQ